MKRLPLPLVKMIARVTALCPRFVFALRYDRWSKKIIDWRNPRNLQEFSMCQLFSKDTSLDFFAMLADKVAVRNFVKERIGEEYLNELYATWTSPNDINMENLPNRFVLKTNNGCGCNVIIYNKKEIDLCAIKKKFDYWLYFPYGDLTGQLQYSRIKPFIMAEKFLEQKKGVESLPYDYKFFCFKGKPQFVLYYESRKLNEHVAPNMLFDMEWNPIIEAVKHPISHKVECPQSFSLMKKLAARLSEGIDFVRVDFYEIDGRPIFGEMTLTPTMINIKPQFAPLMQAFRD